MSKVNVYRVVILVVDHDQLGRNGLIENIEAARYPNRCVTPRVMQVDERTIDWSDDHPLNQKGRSEFAFQKLFGRTV
jgi:hypothetical protein